MKLRGKKDTKAPSRDPEKPSQGISGKGNALRGAWLQAIAIALLPLITALAFLFLVREPARSAAVLEEVANGYASQRANAVADAVAGLRQRVAAAAQSAIAIEAIADPEGAASQSAESSLLGFFSDAVSLRLLSLGEMGTAEVGNELERLRNHIEIDLVRRAANGDEAQPEAYQVDGQWLVSLAGVGSRADLSRRAVILATLPGTQAAQWLGGEDLSGQLQLQQRIGANRGAVITSVGSGEDPGLQRAEVGGTPWEVVFRPSAALRDSLSSKARGDYDLLLLVAILAVVGMLLAWRRSSTALKRDVDSALAGAESRAPFTLEVPELVPLAREVRKLGLRRGRNTAVAPAQTTGAGAAGTATVTGIEGPAEEPLPAHIFRAYDIRGIADTELTDETVYRIGSAIGTIAGSMDEQTLVLAHDGRTSSARIAGIVEKALLRTGRDVIRIGLVPTPLLYFATQHLEAQSGIVVTGSHNPAEYNGMKIVLKRESLAAGSIEKIREIAQEGRFSKGKGQAVQQDVLSDYLDEVLGDIAIAVPQKIVIDASNGAAALIAPALLEELGCEVVSMNCEIDGSFPGHPPDTSDERNLKDLSSEVVSSGADFGVAYDGDGDRLAVVTGSGRILRTDTLMMLFARDVVTRNPGADVVYDVKCSRMLAQLISGLGGRPVLWKTGHALMRRKMVETGALLGGEFSGHIFFGERWYGFDDGMYATARLAEILSSHDANLDELLADLPSGVSTPEIRIPVDESKKFDIARRFVEEARFEDGKANDLDGLRIDFHEGWGLLRASNTSAALTARFEGNDEAALQHIMGLFREQLAAIEPDLDIPF